MPPSAHIRAIRSRIGNDLLMLPAVAVAVFDDAGRLLLAQDAASGLWMTIGGAVEPDETPADAAARECWEETGLLVEAVRILGVFGGPEFRITYGNGDVVSYVVTVFLARPIGGDPSPDGVEASALRYVTRQEAATLAMGPWTRTMVTHAFSCNEIPYFAPPAWRAPIIRI